MLEAGKITSKQLILLLVLSRISITLTFFVALEEPPNSQDVWLVAFPYFPIALLGSAPIYLLWKRFSNQTIIEYSQVVAGFAGKFIGMLYLWYFLTITSISIMQFTLFFTSTIMPETPNLFFVMTIILLSAFIVRMGLEVISRFAELVGPVVMIGILVTSLLLAKDFNLNNLKPFLENRIFPVVHGGFITVMRTAEIVALTMLLPYINQKQKAKSLLLWTFSVIAIYLLVVLLPVILVIGFEHAKEHFFLYFETVRLIDVGDLIERAEPVVIFAWTFTMFVRIPLFYYLTVLSLSQLLKLQDYKPLILPVGTVMVPLSFLLVPSLIELSEFLSEKVFKWYGFFYIVLLPSFLLLTAWIRKKGNSKS